MSRYVHPVVSGLVCLKATLHLSYKHLTICNLPIHTVLQQGRAMLLLPVCKEETKARRGKVVRHASLVQVTDHGIECLYRPGFIQLIQGSGRSLTQ